RDLDPAALGRVADRVADEIAERALQLLLVAGDLRTGACRESDRVALGRQRDRLILGVREEGIDVDPAIAARARAALESREREEIGDEVVHALGLLRHQREDALLLGLGEREIAQRL